MRYLHTMLRISDIDKSLDFFCGKLRFIETHRSENKKGRYTLIFLAANDDDIKNNSPLLELTYNWDAEKYDSGRNFGHLAYSVDDIYDTCHRLMDDNVIINRPPRDGRMAFVKSPDGVSIELLQKGLARPPKEPWYSMPNTGRW